ncbi:hypothetical protein [Jatrophihabitans sp.]|uniref:hypothetical protein n=1 Tax=Jatrophihabitans sp. TaxID=1932789 RepID=UPI0030C6FE49|nr:hypothetical protein [Jatrophihabitans sp.]
MRTRLALGTVGVTLLLFGVFRIFQNSDRTNPRGLARWLIAAVVIHDGILVPTTMAVGFVLTHLFRPRMRRYVQGALVASGLIAIIAVPLIDRRGSQPAVKALEQQNYGLHLGILVVLVFGVAGLAYTAQVVLDRRQAVNATNVRPPAAHDSDT